MIGCVFLTIKTLEDIPFFKIPQHNQIYNKKKNYKNLSSTFSYYGGGGHLRLLN